MITSARSEINEVHQRLRADDDFTKTAVVFAEIQRNNGEPSTPPPRRKERGQSTDTIGQNQYE